jgi:hypothetical protein
MIGRGHVLNEPLSIACYTVIKEHGKANGSLPTGLFFNKVLSILNKEMEEAHMPIHLPHCWYRWGDEVVRVLMPPDLEWIHEDPPRTTVTWSGEPPEIPPGVVVYDRIAQRARQLVATYASPDRIEELVDYVYSYAPFPFQDHYRRLRTMFIDLRGSEIPVENLTDSMLSPLLRNAMVAFPHHDFPELSDRARTFETAMTALLGAGMEALVLARELSEAFWFVFCYFLRLHPAAHQYVPQKTLDYWVANLDTQVTHFDNSFNGILVESADKIPGILADRRIASMVDASRRAREEDLRFIRGFDSELNDLGKFADTIRRAWG